MDYIKKVIRKIEAFEKLGVRVLKDGSKLVGHVPHIGPEAYLHILFAPLSSNEIEDMEKALSLKLTQPLKSFYLIMNGIELFSDTLSVHGHRKSYERSGESIWQPYSMIEINEERPRDATNDMVFFGSYSSDGSLLYMTEDNKVFRCMPDTITPISEWDSLGDMLNDEFDRISTNFDEQGKKYQKFR